MTCAFLAQCLIFGLDDLPRLIFIRRLQACAVARFAIHAIEHSAASVSADQAVTSLHNFTHANARINEAAPKPLKSNGRFTVRYVEFGAGLQIWCPFWCPLRLLRRPFGLRNLHNSLLHSQLRSGGWGRN